MTQATIWNPDTTEKKVINVGETIPDGFKLWTGGTASGQEAKQAIINAPKVEPTNNLDANTMKEGMSSPDLSSQLPDNSASNEAMKVYNKGILTDASKTSTDIQKQIDTIKAQQIKEAQIREKQANEKIATYEAGTQSAIDAYKTDLANKTTAIQSVYTPEYYTSQLNERKSITDEILGYSKLIDGAINEFSTPSLASVASGRKNAVIADYGSRISVKQAALSAIDGNFSLASSILEKGVNTLDDFYTKQLNFNKLAKEVFKTSDVKELTDKAIADLETKKTSLEATKTAINNLLSSPDTAPIVQKAGILLTDTAEQVAGKLQAFYAKNPGYSKDNIETNKKLIEKYGDAGINIYDTPDVVKTKLANSKLYQNETNKNVKDNYIEVGTDALGNKIYYDVVSKKTVNMAGMPIGTVGGYDISSYATDPNHEASVQSILDSIGTLKTADDIANYIKKVSPNSPITAQMIQNTSQKYGVSWEMLLAMMKQDSNLGTAGKGARTFNPGNVGNDDSGNIRNYGNWQAGVDAVGNWLSNHRATEANNTAENWANSINNGTAKLSDVPDKLKSSVISALQGTTSKSKDQTVETINHALSLIDELESDKSALKVATGLTSNLNRIQGTKGYNIARIHNSLIDSLAITNLDKLKGPMSDKDIQFIRNATSKLDLGMSFKAYTKELENLKTYLKTKLGNAQTTSSESDPLNLGINNDPLKLF